MTTSRMPASTGRADRRVQRALLGEAGVRPAHIDDAPPCTKCNPERFFSYRRDGKEGGIHMGFIGLR